LIASSQYSLLGSGRLRLALYQHAAQARKE
jgi:hypothetical protein